MHSLFIFEVMRYHYTKPEMYFSMYGEAYECNHPVYNKCTLYRIGNRGLAVIQQRYDQSSKMTSWGEIDPWLTDEIYLSGGFKKYFNTNSGKCTDGLYPTVTVRQIMWALKMKPLKKEKWETVFDHSPI